MSGDSSLLSKLFGGAAHATGDARDRIVSSAVDQISDFGVRRFTVDELPRQRRLFASAHALLQRALTENDVTRETLIAYVRAQAPDIIHNA